jgi:methionine biosynthesis protein MetW
MDVVKLVPTSARSILDLGCSNGALGAALKLKIPGVRIVGVEYDQELLLEAQKRVDHVVAADLDSFTWSDAVGDEQFDVIIMADILEHLRCPSAALDKARAKLKPGGRMVISVPNIRHITSLFSIYLQGTFPRRGRGIHDRTHLRWFTRRDIEALCYEAGLSIEQIDVNIRLLDAPGARLNTYVSKLGWMKRFALFREFFGYQILVVTVANAGTTANE